MDKILQTQLVNIYNHIDAQSEEIEMAARLLAQAIHSEGEIFMKTFHDIAGMENYLTEGTLSLAKAKRLDDISRVGTPDRVLVAADMFDEEVKAFTESLESAGVEFVLICNFNKHESERLNQIHHYIDLSSPRPLIPTPNFDKIVNPYMSAFLYIYNHLYVLIDEMTNEDY
ncbi:hypothetical protein WN59_05890 [Salinicoccus sediminis]|uniref:DUF2529 domain-containing protein n=1 Tax=Salinicoccus sediminis TaxID=1432562 RepID=A0A0M2SLP9_9STAP|nr:DUF2529 family protein [Salinicoccus sediminis]KKK35153.1 hypothetical protein WN59_05890 [Salinicoccus sediminis]